MNSKRENKVPHKPRFDYVTNKAYEFLIEYGYSRFPIDSFSALNNLSENVTCLSWSDARKVLKHDDPFHLVELKAEARTVFLRDSNEYLMVYDDVHYNYDKRIMWTIMHEIGHIVLGHLTDFEATSLKRGGLTKDEYGILEVEAHFFAAEVLMPTELVRCFTDISIEEMELLFGVSEEAAQKKYKRVFESDYLPWNSYHDKLIRNFYSFLENEIDSTIYHNIYGTWGIPIKGHYVSLCRKCPNCFSYITEKDAVFCNYCGAEINQKHTYKSMLHRLNEQQQFAKSPGFSHPNLYVDNIISPNYGEVERTLFCYNCLNDNISAKAVFCSICGQPLINSCENQCRTLRIKDAFCMSCGAKTLFHSCYLNAEKRLKHIGNSSHHKNFSQDWLLYPYWEYVKMRFITNRDESFARLGSALMYSMAYLDDDNNVVIYADTAMATSIIIQEKDTILDFMRCSDDVEYPSLEVYTSYDI